MSSVVKPKVTARSILVRTLLAALLPSRPLASYSIFAWWLLSFAFSFSTFQARRLLSQPLRFRFALTPLLASQARSIHVSVARCLPPIRCLFHSFVACAVARISGSSTHLSFATYLPPIPRPFRSFVACTVARISGSSTRLSFAPSLLPIPPLFRSHVALRLVSWRVLLLPPSLDAACRKRARFVLSVRCSSHPKPVPFIFPSHHNYFRNRACFISFFAPRLVAHRIRLLLPSPDCARRNCARFLLFLRRASRY